MYNDEEIFQRAYKENLVTEKSKRSFMMKKDLINLLKKYMDKKYEMAVEKSEELENEINKVTAQLEKDNFDINETRSLIKEHQLVILETGIIRANEIAANIIKIPKKAISALKKGFAKKEEKAFYSVNKLELKIDAINKDMTSLDDIQINEKSKNLFIVILKGKKFVLEKQNSFANTILNVKGNIKDLIGKVKNSVKKFGNNTLVNIKEFGSKVDKFVYENTNEVADKGEAIMAEYDMIGTPREGLKNTIITKLNYASLIFLRGEYKAYITIKNLPHYIKDNANQKFIKYRNYIDRLHNHVSEFNEKGMPDTTIQSLNKLLSEYDSAKKSEKKKNSLLNKYDDIKNVLDSIDSNLENKTELKAIRNANIYESEIVNKMEETKQAIKENEIKNASAEIYDDINALCNELDKMQLDFDEKIEGDVVMPSKEELEHLKESLISPSSLDSIMKSFEGSDITFKPAPLIEQLNKDYKTEEVVTEQPKKVKVTPVKKTKTSPEKNNNLSLKKEVLELKDLVTSLKQENKQMLKEFKKLSAAISMKNHIDSEPDLDMKKNTR